MINSTKMPNRLVHETSPYLLQHAYNPVDWYPWGDEAFDKAKAEDKPVFLSVGYSTCHWCHVMAHESFEDYEVAQIMNRDFVCIKVDKEERPDIDNIYMSVCMALTGSGGWPMTVIMDHTGKPFFAGTYFPKHSRYGMPGLMDLLESIHERWENNRYELLNSAEKIIEYISQPNKHTDNNSHDNLVEKALSYYRSTFDEKYGGFGRAPKFPTPHNLIFLLELYQNTKDADCLNMAEKTLVQMAKGGIFDHVGFGFSRYSTDEKWLVPHFEKMLYDNALLIMAYTKAYELTFDPVYKSIVKKTIHYIKREMTNPYGGCYSAQDADSDNVEGKYYVFTPNEIISVLGSDIGMDFCSIYDITENGNFEGKNIPNQIKNPELDNKMDHVLSKLYKYRKKRTKLHKDDKVLTSWNSLMIAALADASVIFNSNAYLESAQRIAEFIENNLYKSGQVFASFRDGRLSNSGFIDDCAFYIFALIKLYKATLNSSYLKRAEELALKTIEDFFDYELGGFYLYGKESEALIARPKETYDGAIPSGNSVMTMNLLLLMMLTGESRYKDTLDKQIDFMSARAANYPGGYSFFLLTLLKKDFPGRKITAILGNETEKDDMIKKLRGKDLVIILEDETDEYKLINGKTTYYICENNVCRPPVNELDMQR